MARPKKIGLDYFPLDTSIDMDDKVQLIEAEFGVKGFAIIIKLLCKIYADKGYYYSWTEIERLLFAKRTGETVGLVDNVVKRSVKWGLFNKSLFNQFQILTSEAIQIRFLDAIKRRETINIIKEYILFDVNAYRNEVNVNINLIDVNNNPQSKVEKSKVKESKEDTGDVKKSDPKEKKQNPPPDSAPPPTKYPFSSQAFIQKWGEWKDFRKKELKKPYKSNMGEQKALSHCANLADGDEKTAIGIIDQSMGNRWQGFFELKTKSYGKPKQGTQKHVVGKDIIFDEP